MRDGCRNPAESGVLCDECATKENARHRKRTGGKQRVFREPKPKRKPRTSPELRARAIGILRERAEYGLCRACAEPAADPLCDRCKREPLIRVR